MRRLLDHTAVLLIVTLVNLFYYYYCRHCYCHCHCLVNKYFQCPFKADIQCAFKSYCQEKKIMRNKTKTKKTKSDDTMK